MLPEVDALVCDANILIDFCDEDRELLSVISREVIALHVPVPILSEVDQLDIETAENLGIVIEDIPLEYLDEERRLSGCSKQDSACYHLANEKGWGCATNEKQLKKHCDKHRIPVVRGLRLILAAVEKGAVARKRAEQAGKGIIAANGWIKPEVLQAFIEELEGISG